jgi:hypothetical protein
MIKQKVLNIMVAGARGSLVATSWKVAGSKPDEITFLIYLILPAALGPGVY